MSRFRGYRDGAIGGNMAYMPTRTLPRWRAWRRPFGRIATIIVALVVISGCYMPMRFDAEIEITRTGHFSFIFDGYLAKVQLYDDLRQNKITPTQEKEEIEKIRKDMARDKSASEFSYLRKGYFRVHWERKGDLLASKTVIFMRRNEHMLGISYNNETGRAAVSGRSLKRDTRKKLDEIGLGGANGEIRVISDAPVLRHNATTVKKLRSRGAGFKMYIWKIKNIYAPTPSIIIALR